MIVFFGMIDYSKPYISVTGKGSFGNEETYICDAHFGFIQFLSPIKNVDEDYYFSVEVHNVNDKYTIYYEILENSYEMNALSFTKQTEIYKYCDVKWGEWTDKNTCYLIITPKTPSENLGEDVVKLKLKLYIEDRPDIFAIMS